MARQLFKMRIGNRRQLTLPEKFMDLFGLSTGDELGFEIKGPRTVEVVGYKQVRTELMRPDVQQLLDEREAEAATPDFDKSETDKSAPAARARTTADEISRAALNGAKDDLKRSA